MSILKLIIPVAVVLLVFKFTGKHRIISEKIPIKSQVKFIATIALPFLIFAILIFLYAFNSK